MQRSAAISLGHKGITSSPVLLNMIQASSPTDIDQTSSLFATALTKYSYRLSTDIATRFLIIFSRPLSLVT